MVITLILIFLLFFLLLLESRITHKSVSRIRMRVHINGTRGKSSITKYLSTALQKSGIKTMGKVTGEIPTWILPDGSLTTIRRRGPARIQEQFRTIRRAARLGVEVLVLECMSIDPSLQATESQYYKPHICVLSRIRDDHREKLGGTPDEQVAAMCSSIPTGGIVVTNDTDNLEAIRAEANKRNCRVVTARSMDPGEHDLKELPAEVFQENIELAVEAALLAGISREKAQRAILDEIGRHRKDSYGKSKKLEMTFLNAFSVNDPESTTLFLNKWEQTHGFLNKPVLIFNTRSDRPLRTKTFSNWIRDRKGNLKGVIITGDHRAWAYANLRQLQPPVEVFKIRRAGINGLQQRLLQVFGVDTPVIGIGNIKGPGYLILKEFENDR